MAEEIILDKSTFEALAIDTRVDILKSLKERNKTASELSKELNLAVSTVSEHLDKMKKANLIKRREDNRKWVYYQLTEKGKNIIAPKSTSVFVFALLISLIMVVVGLYWFDISAGLVTEAVYSGPSFGAQKGGQMITAPAGAPSRDTTHTYWEESNVSPNNDTTGTAGATIEGINDKETMEAPKLEVSVEEDNIAPLSEAAYQPYEMISMGDSPFIPNMAVIFIVIGLAALAVTLFWWFKR